MKQKLAPQMHDKVLFADAKMMKADWMAESATAVGVVGTGFGLWWLDPLAAAIVSADILKDGLGTLKTAVADLMDRRPEKADKSDYERLPEEIERLFGGYDWVESVRVRMRDEGHILLDEAFLVPRDGTPDLVRKISQAAEEAKALDWDMVKPCWSGSIPLDQRPRDRCSGARSLPGSCRFRPDGSTARTEVSRTLAA